MCWVEVLCGAGEQPHRPARLLDLSTAGARIALLAPIDVGVELRLTLLQAEGPPSVLTGSINRVTRTNSGWEAGCTLSVPMTEDQLAAILTPLGLNALSS
jgi:hypothetical protein